MIDTDYLRQVAADYRESGSTCTADDYEITAATIDELRAALRLCLKCLDLYGQPSAQTAVEAARATLAKVER